MPNTSVPAAVTGLPEINRRRFIANAGLGAVAATTVAVPVTAEGAAPEHPWDLARRLGRELSEVLAADIGDGIGPGGAWYAEIHPASESGHDVMFGSISARNWPCINISLPCQKIIDAHKEARIAFEKTCLETDSVALGREPSKAAWRRYRQASRAEETALTAVCALHPHGGADATAKARYLKKFVEWGELTSDQVIALIYSGVRT